MPIMSFLKTEFYLNKSFGNNSSESIHILCISKKIMMKTNLLYWRVLVNTIEIYLKLLLIIYL